MGNKKILLTILCLILSGNALQVDPNYDYEEFCAWTNCTYEGEEYEAHKAIFDKKYAEYLERVANGEEIKITKFFDWNQTQRAAFFNYHIDLKTLKTTPHPLQSGLVGAAPSSFDWRSTNKVTSVKNQGDCGSCWAFTATAVYQSQALIVDNKPLSLDLAEQYLLQCDTANSKGCEGGFQNQALEYLRDHGGIPYETAFPYRDQQSPYGNGICSATGKVKISKPITKILLQKNISQEDLKENLILYGPLTVAVHSENSAFENSPVSGEINNCPPTTQQMIDHAVVLVGYTPTHWIIKNSWDTDWGLGGYGKISRSNDCGIRTLVAGIMVDKGTSPAPSSTVSLIISMTDSYGDGWNGNVLAFKEGSNVLKVFGSTFTSGSSKTETVTFSTTGSTIQIVVNTMGYYSKECGFTIKYFNGTVVYQRNAGVAFTSSTVFSSFCPNCATPSQKITYRISMTDSYGDGWNGNVLYTNQNGVKQYFGSSFTSGHNFGPVNMEFTIGQQFTIGVHTLGNYPTEVGFSIRDLSGNLVFNFAAGQSFSANTILGTVCPGCLNLSPVKNIPQEDGNPENMPRREGQNANTENSGTKEQSTTDVQGEPTEPVTVVFIMLTIFLFILFTAAMIYSCKLKRRLSSKVYRQQNATLGTASEMRSQQVV